MSEAPELSEDPAALKSRQLHHGLHAQRAVMGGLFFKEPPPPSSVLEDMQSFPSEQRRSDHCIS